MSTSRQEILEYIRIHGAVSAVEIARALRMTRANAHHHLDILCDMDQIEVIGSRPTGGRGRPAHLYRLSERNIGDNLDTLASAFLQVSYQNYEDRDHWQFLQSLAHIIVDQIAAELNIDKASGGVPSSLTLRLNRAVQILNQMKYQSRWEAHADAPNLILGHCPYARIIDQHPELCQLDGMIIEEILGHSVMQVSKLSLNPSGLRFCQFRIGSFGSGSQSQNSIPGLKSD